eukprot:SAG31_NODE_2217_length_6168_cov_10.730598_10_plen_150_part_01
MHSLIQRASALTSRVLSGQLRAGLRPREADVEALAGDVVDELHHRSGLLMVLLQLLELCSTAHGQKLLAGCSSVEKLECRIGRGWWGWLVGRLGGEDFVLFLGGGGGFVLLLLFFFFFFFGGGGGGGGGGVGGGGGGGGEAPETAKGDRV